jgi:NTE family protein
VLEEEGIHIDMIAGTSIGALVGGAYARSASVSQVQKWTIDEFTTLRRTRHKLFDYTIPLRGILRGRKIYRMISTSLGDADFLDLLIPMSVITVDIYTGEEVLLDRGPLSKAIMASISVPGMFPPVHHYGRWLLDGGLVNPVPVDVILQKGADMVIAVSVARERERATSEGPPTIVEVLGRAINIVHSQVTKDFAKQADIVIYPRVSAFALEDFHMGRALMQAGMQACREQLADIKQRIVDKSSQG